jgi:hypothetical protein
MRAIYIAYQNEKHEKDFPSKDKKTPTDRESPVVVIGG